MNETEITVLLIEDNPADTRLIRELLEEEKSVQYEIVHVNDLEAGLKRLAESAIDVILLDLTLPDSQGIETFHRINTRSPEIPVVVLTGVKDELLGPQLLRAGAQDFLNKGSINYCVLKQTLRHAIERNRADRSTSTKLEPKPANPVHDQLLAQLCYELVKPMASLLSKISPLTSNFANNADFLLTLDMVRLHVERQRRLIDDTLEYARIETDGDVFRPTDYETIFKSVLENLKEPIDKTRAVITHEPLPTLSADAAQIRDLFHNLIENAITFRGQNPPKIHVNVTRNRGDYVFSIRDNGNGFDPVHSERIFAIYERLVHDDSQPSTGAGLAICRKIVQRHGGQIWAKSEPDQGSCFFFTMPARGNRNL